MWIIFRRMAAVRGEAGGAIDWLGTALITTALGAITWSLNEAPVHHDLRIAAVAAAGVICLLVCVFVEHCASTPPVPLTLCRSSAFSAANVLTLLLYSALS